MVVVVVRFSVVIMYQVVVVMLVAMVVVVLMDVMMCLAGDVDGCNGVVECSGGSDRDGCGNVVMALWLTGGDNVDGCGGAVGGDAVVKWSWWWCGWLW